VAFDGTNFLVVWGDYRGGDCDIYGARVSRSGTVLDPSGIAISTAAGYQYAPAAAFDGADFLVVWTDQRNGQNEYDIYGARVSPAGTVLDPDGVAISVAAYSHCFPAVAFDGTNSLVVWHDLRNGSYDIYGARLSQAGTVLDPDGVVVSTAANDQQYPAVAFDGTNFLVVWQDYRSFGDLSDIYGARVSQTGIVLDPSGVIISAANSVQAAPAVSYDGADFLVVWEDWRNNSWSDVYGARVNPAGVVLDPSGIAISTAEDDQYTPAVAFDGANFLVVWEDWRPSTGDCDVYGARVSPAGAVLDPDGIVISSAEDDQYVPAVAFDGANFLVVWMDGRGYHGYNIYGARVSQAGAVLDTSGIAVSMAADDQYYPAVASDGANSLVVWEDYRTNSDTSDIYGARVSQAGTVIDTAGLAISTAAGWQMFPVAASDGTNFLVVWTDHRIHSDCDIYGARVSPAGVVFDSGPVCRQEGCQHDPTLARGSGNQTLLVYQGWAGTVGGKTYNNYRIWGKMDPNPGIEETMNDERGTMNVGPTIVRGVLRLPVSPFTIHTSLFDMTGRQVMSLRPGPNDVRHLAPGVYFIREAQAQAQAQAVQKVVITK
jgi:endo-1,4-beta-D-glucanase Y